MIDFKWSAGQWYYQSIDECPGTVWVKDINGVRKMRKKLLGSI